MARVMFGLAILAACGACTSRTVFLHDGHRDTYGIQEDELKQLRFYLSDKAVFRDLSPARRGSPEGVIVVPKGTQGVVTEVGWNWLRVSFDDASIEGARFIAIVEDVDDPYWLATDVEGGTGLRKVRDVPGRVFLHQGRSYELFDGVHSRLLVNQKDLDKLIESRRHLRGRKQ